MITQTHGLKGEVKVYPTTDDPERFRRLKHVLIRSKGGERPLEIRSVRFQKGLVLLTFAGLDRIEDVQPMKGSDILIERADAEPLRENEFFVGDLVGLQVITDEGRALGILSEVIDTAANDVYAVRREDGKVILLPAVLDVIRDVDLDAGVVTVHLLPGLEELNG